MVGPIRTLADLARKGGSLTVTCSCGQTSIFDVSEMAFFITQMKATKGWTDAWPGFAKHLRCSECGAREPKVSWSPMPPPPRDPTPPRPRFARKGEPTNVIDFQRVRRGRDAA